MYVQNITTSTCNQYVKTINELLCIFSYEVFEMWCVLYTYSTQSDCLFQVLYGHM